MKTITKIAATTIVLLLMLIADIPLLPVELVPEAQAILGVRRRTARRTAVVAYSAGAATASAATAASQQQAATAQQQAAVAQQQAAPHAVSGVPVGTVVQALPAECTAVTVGGSQYQDCNGTFYRAAFQGNNLVYVVVENPL